MLVAAVLFAAMIATPVQASWDDLRLQERLGVCAQYPVGSDFCLVEDAVAALDALEPAWGYRLRENDAFAIVTVLGKLHAAMAARLDTGLCAPGDLMAYEVDEIWAGYIGPVAEGVDDAYRADFAVVEGFVGNAIAYLTNERCARP